MLATLFTRRDPNVRRKVHQAHPGLSPILVLSAGAASPKGLDATLGQQAIVALGNRDQGWIGHGGCRRMKRRTSEAMVRVEGTR